MVVVDIIEYPGSLEHVQAFLAVLHRKYDGCWVDPITGKSLYFWHFQTPIGVRLNPYNSLVVTWHVSFLDANRDQRVVEMAENAAANLLPVPKEAWVIWEGAEIMAAEVSPGKTRLVFTDGRYGVFTDGRFMEQDYPAVGAAFVNFYRMILQELGLKNPWAPAGSESEAESAPWNQIPDHGWDRLALWYWHEGHTCPEIASQLEGRPTAKTVTNRLCALRGQYGEEIVPTRKMLKGK